jgi:hypothetical protein
MQQLEKSIQNIEGPAVNEQLPRAMRGESETLTAVLEDYYRFVNAEQGPSYTINRLIAEHDLDKVFDDTYIDAIRKEIAVGTPVSPYLQKTFLLKRLVDSYTSRGSEVSIEYLFRMFFDDNITIFKPWEHVLIPSAGKWETEIRSQIVLAFGSVEDLEGSEIVQYDQFGALAARAAVKTIARRIVGNAHYFDIVLYQDTNYHAFGDSQPIQTLDGKAYGFFFRSLAQINIADGGQGYAIDDRIYIGGKEDISFNARVAAVDEVTGTITTIEMTYPGVSATVNYPAGIINDPEALSGVSEMYLNGVVSIDTNGFYFFDTAPDASDTSYQFALADDPQLLQPMLGIDMDIYATRSDNGLTIQSSTQKFGHTVLHDFEVYDTQSTTPELNYSKQPRSLSNVVVRSAKVDPDTNPASFTFAFNTIYETRGAYANAFHRPSGISVLQDSFYYQIFSYEINSEFPMNEWEDLVDSFIHPAGFKYFASTTFSAAAALGSNLLGYIDDDSDVDDYHVYEMLQMLLTAPIKIKSELGLIELGEDGPGYSADPYASNKFSWDLELFDDETMFDLTFTLGAETFDLILSSNTLDAVGAVELELPTAPDPANRSGFLTDNDTLPDEVFLNKWEKNELGVWVRRYAEV